MALRTWALTALRPTPFRSEWRRIVRLYILLTRTAWLSVNQNQFV